MPALQHCDDLLVLGVSYISCKDADRLEIRSSREGLPERIVKIMLAANQGRQLPEVSPGDVISLDYHGLCIHAIYQGNEVLYAKKERVKPS